MALGINILFTIYAILALQIYSVHPFLFDLKNCTKWPAAKFEDEEIRMNVPEIIQSKGYPFEKHNVVTSDGYILTMHRIPFGKRNTTAGRRPPIFLQHGLFDSSFTWVANFDHNSLAFMLADAGFDVWLGNNRGNTYSKAHITLKTSSKDFWAFTWDEIADYDLPASIDYVLNATGFKTLNYVGHSQGTVIAFAEFSINKNLASKIETFYALAPVATVGHMKSPFRLLTPFAGALHFASNLFGGGEFLPNDKMMQIVTSAVCGTGDLRLTLCKSFVFLFAGFDCLYSNQTRLPVYASKLPAGTSVQNMVKWAQGVKSGNFQRYDYGYFGNLKHYQQSSPPKFDITQMNVPTVVFYGGSDWLADVKDVDYVLNSLPNIVEKVYIDKYNHMDFVWGVNADTVIYNKIISRIKSDLKW